MPLLPFPRTLRPCGRLAIRMRGTFRLRCGSVHGHMQHTGESCCETERGVASRPLQASLAFASPYSSSSENAGFGSPRQLRYFAQSSPGRLHRARSWRGHQPKWRHRMSDWAWQLHRGAVRVWPVGRMESARLSRYWVTVQS